VYFNRQNSGSLVGNCQLSLCPGNNSPKLLRNSNLNMQFFSFALQMDVGISVVKPMAGGRGGS